MTGAEARNRPHRKRRKDNQFPVFEEGKTSGGAMPVAGAFVGPTPRRIRVRLGGVLVADSSRAQLPVQYGRDALPTYYLPHDDVRPGALVDESTGIGGQRKWTVRTDVAQAVDAAWTGRRPDRALHRPSLNLNL